jgi:diguanylate cyclase (GGDEF)-like protein
MSWFGPHPEAPDPQRLALAERIANQIAVACERRQLEQRLAQIAGRDALTGVASRAHILEALESRMHSKRNPPTQVAIALVDLDGFKAINDERGHGFGDRVLKDIGCRIRDICRRGDDVGRLGGDEFVVISEYRDRRSDVAPLLDRLNLVLNIGMPIGRRTHRLSASIGVACFPEDGQDAETLLRRADLAMYHAKREGGSRYYFFNSAMEDDVRERQLLLDEIPPALAHGQFELHYQPILRMDARQTTGVEALVRWRHPEKGLCSAGQFIPIIERHGHALVRQLGQWVLAAAVGQLRQWQHRRLGLAVHVNVSACYFLDHGFIRDLERVLAAFPGLDPTDLVIELTETALLEDLDKAAAVMEACRAMRVRLALDDFGTGYASLTYLKRLPVDTVKIDQSFVKDLCNQPNDRGIVRGILAMANALNLSVVAEGVETDAHVTELLRLGCVQMQGYGLGMPQPGADLEAWLIEQQGFPAEAVSQ